MLLCWLWKKRVLSFIFFTFFFTSVNKQGCSAHLAAAYLCRSEMSSVSALNFCFYRNNMCENTSAVRLPGVWLDDSGANKQFWFQEDSCFLPSANIYLKTRYLHRNNIWGFTLRCTHCHGDGGEGRGITPTPHLQQGENLSSLSSNTPWMRRRTVCGFLNGCTVHGLRDVTSPSLLSSPTWFQPCPRDWTEGQIWLWRACRLDELVDESLMDSARLFVFVFELL